MDPNMLMQGAPPSDDNQVTLDNWRTPPFNKWAFQHISEITLTAAIYNNPDNIRTLESVSSDLMDIQYPHGDETVSISEMIERTDCDGFLVLHSGKIVLEEYRNSMTERSRHILFSVTKSVTSLVAGILVGRGELNPEAPVTTYIPEAVNTAFGDAKVQNVLDMTVSLDFNEDYTATEGPIVEYRESTGWNQRTTTPPDLHLRGFLLTLKDRKGKNGKHGEHGEHCAYGEHGERFSYMSPVTDLLGWILERASGKRYADLVSETLWQPMGAGYDAYMSNDAQGAPRTAGGLCTTLRDLALVGQLICDEGKRDGVEIVPKQWIEDIRNNGDRAQWLAGDFATEYPDWPLRYRNKWYVMGDNKAPLFGVGIYNQFLYVNPEKELVIVQFSSQPDPVNDDNELLALRAFEAISNSLE